MMLITTVCIAVNREINIELLLAITEWSRFDLSILLINLPHLLAESQLIVVGEMFPSAFIDFLV